MNAPHQRLHEAIAALVERTSTQLRAGLEGLVREAVAQGAAAEAEAARAARGEVESAAAAVAAGAIAAERSRAEDRVREAVETARQEHGDALARIQADHGRALAELRGALERDGTSTLAAQREADLASSAAVLDGIRALDAAASITELLDTLFTEGARHVPRVALLVADDRTLRGWRWQGFGPADARALRVPLDAPDLVSRAAREGVTCAATEAHGAADTGTGQPLAPAHPGRAAAAVPVAIDGRTVAVLYADDDLEGVHETPSAWPEALEVLARHAARCGEALTVRRLPELVRASAAAALESGQADEEAAQRYARLLVAEIKLYHEPDVDEGRRARDLLRRLRPQIERAQKLYEERVPAAIRARTRYFADELVKTLANGDPTLLGQAT